VNDGEHGRANHGEQRHGFGKAVDGIPPGLLEEQKNRRNQRAGVADTDPPDEVDNGKAPRDGDGDAPDAGAFKEEPGNGDHEQHGDAAGKRKAEEPAQGSMSRQHNPRQFLSHRAEGVPWGNNQQFARLWVNHRILRQSIFGSHAECGPLQFAEVSLIA
jgi:hypothetical protein